MLQVIAAVAARRAGPLALSSFRGSAAAMFTQPLKAFPKPQTGYTVCLSLRLCGCLEPGENLVFSWRDSQYIIFEMFVRVWPREPAGLGSGPSSLKQIVSASRSLRRTLLTSKVSPGSRYRRGQST